MQNAQLPIQVWSPVGATHYLKLDKGRIQWLNRVPGVSRFMFWTIPSPGGGEPHWGDPEHLSVATSSNPQASELTEIKHSDIVKYSQAGKRLTEVTVVVDIPDDATHYEADGNNLNWFRHEGDRALRYQTSNDVWEDFDCISRLADFCRIPQTVYTTPGRHPVAVELTGHFSVGNLKFERDLSEVINKHSMENGSDTPDYILGTFLANVLQAFDTATTAERDARSPYGAEYMDQCSVVTVGAICRGVLDEELELCAPSDAEVYAMDAADTHTLFARKVKQASNDVDLEELLDECMAGVDDSAKIKLLEGILNRLKSNEASNRG